MGQHLFDKTKTEHDKLHKGSIHCGNVVLNCMIFSYLYLSKKKKSDKTK